MYSLGAGFRYSPYGPKHNPGADYWTRVGQDMAGRFIGAIPEAIWIVSVLEGSGTHLTFPGESAEPGISFSLEDQNQIFLDRCDHLGYRVWLQVEPGDAKVETLIDLVLNRYGAHPCVVGLGVDVEWHHSSEEPEGIPVTDEEAASWLKTIRRHNGRYSLFLKHWETRMLPPSLHEGLLFVDDSQMFSSLEHMLVEFARWGEHYYPAPVAFQVGYPADKKWWGDLHDPASVIGKAILERVPNTAGLFWVDFSALDVFPPQVG